MKSSDIWFVLGFCCAVAELFASQTLDYLLSHHDKIRNLALVAGALLGAPVVLWRTTIAHQESQTRDKEAKTREEDAKTRQQDANTNSANAVATAYAQAITQLGWSDSKGNPVIEGRLGAIYALEKIAINNIDYRRQIIRLLTSYVRQHTDIYQCKDYSEGPYANSPRPDIQGVFDVFSHDSGADLVNSVSSDKEDLRFSHCHLRRVKFTPKGLKCGFHFSDLIWADLDDAVFKPLSSFYSCPMQGAYLSRSIIRLCDFEDTIFKDTHSDGSFANLAKLRGADIRGAIVLTEDQLSGLGLSTTKRDKKFACDQDFPEGNDDSF